MMGFLIVKLAQFLTNLILLYFVLNFEQEISLPKKRRVDVSFARSL